MTEPHAYVNIGISKFPAINVFSNDRLAGKF